MGNDAVIFSSLACLNLRRLLTVNPERTMMTAKRLLVLLLVTVSVQHLWGQNFKPSITSWAPTRAGFESTAVLPQGAEVRILVVTTGHTGHFAGRSYNLPRISGLRCEPRCSLALS